MQWHQGVAVYLLGMSNYDFRKLEGIHILVKPMKDSDWIEGVYH